MPDDTQLGRNYYPYLNLYPEYGLNNEHLFFDPYRFATPIGGDPANAEPGQGENYEPDPVGGDPYQEVIDQYIASRMNPVYQDPQASPTGQAAGNSATASGINDNAQMAHTALSGLMGIAGTALGMPGITGIGKAINMMGLNELNLDDVQVNNELSTNNPAIDIANIQNAIAAHRSQEAMDIANELGTPVTAEDVDATGIGVGVGGQGGSGPGDGNAAGGGPGSAADGSTGSAGDPGGPGGGGTYARGGAIRALRYDQGGPVDWSQLTERFRPVIDKFQPFVQQFMPKMQAQIQQALSGPMPARRPEGPLRGRMTPERMGIIRQRLANRGPRGMAEGGSASPKRWGEGFGRGAGTEAMSRVDSWMRRNLPREVMTNIDNLNSLADGVIEWTPAYAGKAILDVLDAGENKDPVGQAVSTGDAILSFAPLSLGPAMRALRKGAKGLPSPSSHPEEYLPTTFYRGGQV